MTFEEGRNLRFLQNKKETNIFSKLLTVIISVVLTIHLKYLLVHFRQFHLFSL